MSIQTAHRDIVDFVANFSVDDLSSVSMHRVRDAIIDCLACILAGSRQDLAPILRSVITLVDDDDPAAVSLIGTEHAASPADAALFNGTLAHALDFDDITHPAYAHPSAVLVPAIVSLASAGSASGRDVIAAYVIGLEVFGRLGRALNFSHYRRGWHATSTFGSLAAAATAARLLRLDPTRIRHALSIAGSGASGLRANFGTMTKPLHCGYAARNGVMAAQLAAGGFSGAYDIVRGDYGFAKTFNDCTAVQWDALDEWGSELEIESEYGLALKPYPSCGATHPAIEAALKLREALAGRWDTIESVRVGVPDMAFQPLIFISPETPLQGKFSMPYVIAVALHDGVVNLKSFTEEKLSDGAIAGLLQKVKMEPDARVAESTEFAAIVELQASDGKVYEQQVPLALGKPERWFSQEQLRDKFVDCASLVMNASAAEALFTQLLGMPEWERFSVLSERIKTAGKG